MLHNSTQFLWSIPAVKEQFKLIMLPITSLSVPYMPDQLYLEK